MGLDALLKDERSREAARENVLQQLQMILDSVVATVLHMTIYDQPKTALLTEYPSADNLSSA